MKLASTIRRAVLDAPAADAPPARVEAEPSLAACEREYLALLPATWPDEDHATPARIFALEETLLTAPVSCRADAAAKLRTALLSLESDDARLDRLDVAAVRQVASWLSGG